MHFNLYDNETRGILAFNLILINDNTVQHVSHVGHKSAKSDKDEVQ